MWAFILWLVIRLGSRLGFGGKLGLGGLGAGDSPELANSLAGAGEELGEGVAVSGHGLLGHRAGVHGLKVLEGQAAGNLQSALKGGQLFSSAHSSVSELNLIGAAIALEGTDALSFSGIDKLINLSNKLLTLSSVGEIAGRINHGSALGDAKLASLAGAGAEVEGGAVSGHRF